MDAATVAFVAADSDEAQAAKAHLEGLYPHVEPRKADIIVALGGDGFMLRCLHRNLERQTPIYGMNCGTVGFLMNVFRPEHLLDRLAAAQPVTLYPLRMKARSTDGGTNECLAINEVSLARRIHQAARIRIHVDGKVRLEELVCDGVLVATPAGSTAYNFSAHGPIVPIGANVLALTPISAFRPRRWRGALLPHSAHVVFEVMEPEKRPVNAAADNQEVQDVAEVTVFEDRSCGLTLLFDPEHNLEERIISEQFLP